MLRHLVLLRFRADVTAAARQGFFSDLGKLTGQLDGILDFQHRRNVSVEGPLTQGFDDLFWFDFRDAAARDAYLADPAHQAIGSALVASLDGGAAGVLVADFAT